jgi:hypothetical protein
MDAVVVVTKNVADAFHWHIPSMMMTNPPLSSLLPRHDALLGNFDCKLKATFENRLLDLN